MDKSIRIILFLVMGLVVINFGATLFSNSNIKGIRNDLQKAKATTDSALYELQISKNRLDSIRSDVAVFRAYVSGIQKTVALSDAEKMLRDERDLTQIKFLKDTIKSLKTDIESEAHPIIEVISSRKNN